MAYRSLHLVWMLQCAFQVHLSTGLEYPQSRSLNLTSDGAPIELKSPNYPSNYDDDACYKWVIHAGEGVNILFVIDDFFTEDGYDHVNIGTGANPDEASTTLFTLTGEILSVQFNITTFDDTSAWVTFESDSSVSRRGFRFLVSLVLFVLPPFSCGTGSQLECAPFKCEYGVECNGIQDCNDGPYNDELSADCRCGEDLFIPKDGFVLLASPNHPDHYNTSQTCTWIVHAPEGRYIGIKIISFSTEESYDFVKFGIGSTFGGSPILELTGSYDMGSRHEFITQTLWIALMSDASVTSQGFSLEIYDWWVQYSGCPDVVNKEKLCDGYNDCADGSDEIGRQCYCDELRQVPENGYVTVQSPNYPNKYDPEMTCIWTVQSSMGSSILIEVLYYSIPYGEPLRIGVTDIANSTNEYRQWSEGISPANFSIPANHVWVAFSTKRLDTPEHSGFVIRFSRVNTPVLPVCEKPYFQCVDDQFKCIAEEHVCNGDWYDHRSCDDMSNNIGSHCRCDSDIMIPAEDVTLLPYPSFVEYLNYSCIHIIRARAGRYIRVRFLNETQSLIDIVNVLIGTGDQPNPTTEVDFHWVGLTWETAFDIYLDAIWILIRAVDKSSDNFLLEISEIMTTYIVSTLPAISCLLNTAREFEINPGRMYLLRSDSFPYNYHPNIRCLWTFHTDPAGRILIEVKHMHLDFTGNDVVIFGDGDDPGVIHGNSSAIIVRATWGKKMLKVTSSSNRMWIHFETDDDRRLFSGFYFGISRIDITEQQTGICSDGFSCPDQEQVCYETSAKCDGYIHCSDEFDEKGCQRLNVPTGIVYEGRFIVQPKVTIPSEIRRLSDGTAGTQSNRVREAAIQACFIKCLKHTAFKCRSFISGIDGAHAIVCILMNDTLATLDNYDTPPQSEDLDLFTLIANYCEPFQREHVSDVCPLPMGMESGRINNTQIAASSYSDEMHRPEAGRLRNQLFWRSADEDTNQWLQVSLGRLAFVTGLVLQGSGKDDEGWVKSFTLSYTADERMPWIWNNYTDNELRTRLKGNSEPHCERIVALNPAIHVQYIRINPVEWVRSIDMRLEILGCFDYVCDEPSGLVAETIHTNQITASSAYNATYAPRNARLETIGRFRPGWVPSIADTNPWIEINLHQEFTLRHILTQGCQIDDFWTTVYKIQYLNNESESMVYYGDDDTGEKLFHGNNDRDSITDNELKQEISTSRIRVVPVMWHGLAALRMEMVGCYVKVCGDRLGMQSGEITDAQITRSSTNFGLCSEGPMFRLFNQSHTIGFAFVSEDTNINQYVQVDLGQLHTISGIIMQGMYENTNSMNLWVETFLIHYESVISTGSWLTYKNIYGSDKLFHGNENSNQVKMHQFHRPLITRRLRVNPQLKNNVVTCFRFELIGCPLYGNGIICGDTGYVRDGYCVGAVANDDPGACANIYSEYAQPMLIKSRDAQSSLNSQLEGIVSFDLYKIGLAYNDELEGFAWTDGTPLIYDYFRGDSMVGGIVHDKCVAVDRQDSGIWKTFDCESEVLEVASICQIDLNECLESEYPCTDTCVNVPGTYYCTCPDGQYLDENNRCKDLCLQTDIMDNEQLNWNQTSHYCWYKFDNSSNFENALRSCEKFSSYLGTSYEVLEVLTDQLNRSVWIGQNNYGNNDTNNSQFIKDNNTTCTSTSIRDSQLTEQQVSCSIMLPFYCFREYEQITCSDLWRHGHTSMNTSIGFGHISSFSYAPWYDTGAFCTIKITTDIENIIEFVIQEMFLRRSSNSLDPCLDFLDIENEYTDGTNSLRGRYCGDLKDLKLSSRSNSAVLKLHIGDLTAAMPNKVGFEMWYKTKECSRQNCKSECGGEGFLTNDNGNISTPNYPSPVPPFSRCSWTITLRSGMYIELRFTNFSVERSPDDKRCVDRVSVSSVTAGSGRTSSWNYCGDIHPLIISSTSMLVLEFRTELDSTSLGFKAEYISTAIPGCHVGQTFCQQSEQSCVVNQAFIASCNYPHAYDSNSNSIWRIVTEKGTFVLLEFSDFDVPSGTDCQRNGVTIYDGTMEMNNIVDSYCNIKRPDGVTIISSLNTMTVAFVTTTQEERGRGFLAEYRALNFQSDVEIPSTNITKQPKTCPSTNDWLLNDDQCYIIITRDEPIPWNEADRDCSMMGRRFNLVSIRNQADMDFIHMLLIDAYVKTNVTKSYIGLSLHGVRYNWIDNRPLSYSAWSVPERPTSLLNWEDRQPDGGKLELCSLYNLESIHVTNHWQDVPCASAETKQYVCMTAARLRGDNSVKPPLLEPFKSSFANQTCSDAMFKCGNGECIQRIFMCDGVVDCILDSQDEHNCTGSITDELSVPLTCSPGYFLCGTGLCLHLSYVCDFIAQCPDGKDELNCVFQNCTSTQFTCRNGECIDETLRCNLIDNCVDGTDEDGCDSSSNGFQCYDGTWIPSSALCDGHRDCSGKTWEDEPIECLTNQCDDTKLRCKNGACVDAENTCMYGIDQYGYPTGCRDATHLDGCGDFNCSMFDRIQCPGAYCIDVEHRCDGIMDCPNGEDEYDCKGYTCPGYYRCRGQVFCISQDQLCDGIKQCTDGDDELFCDNDCPAHCSCTGYSYQCVSVHWTPHMASMIPVEVRDLRLSYVVSSLNKRRRRQTTPTGMADTNKTISAMLFIEPSTYTFVARLDISGNGIEYILPNTFSSCRNLLQLILKENKIRVLGTDMFRGLEQLQTLDISDNPLVQAMPRVFQDLGSLNLLDIRNTELKKFDREIFLDTPELDYLYSDQYLFCCLVGDITHCLPKADQFSSCKDLMRNQLLRILMWILGISALVGNVFVIGWRFVPRDGHQKKSKVESVLVSNLALADCFMGIYMVLIASADLYYRGVYVFYADVWQSSFLCKFAGFLSVLSSESSVFFLVILSVDRFLCVVYPLHQIRLRNKSVTITVIGVWMSAFALSVLPVVAYPVFGDAFYGRSGVCLALPLTTERPTGWQYSIVVFLGINLLAFGLITFCYVCIYYSVRTSSRAMQSSSHTIGTKGNTDQIKFATRMAFLIVTDFLCWMPIIIMGFLSQAGVFISGDVYAWTAVLVLPLNSALNPYLYTILTNEMSKAKKKSSSKTSSGTANTSIQSSDNKAYSTPGNVQSNQTEDIGAVLKMTFATVRNSRLIPAMSQARCRAFLLSTYQSRGANKFSREDINSIHADLNRALSSLHRTNFAHGKVNEDYILIEKVPNSDIRRAFLMMSGKEFKTFSQRDESEDQREEETDIDAIFQKDKEDLDNIIAKLNI